MFFGAGALALGVTTSQGNPIGELLLPVPPPFPCFDDRNAVIAEAQRISDRLETHIKDWMDGKASAEIPRKLFPQGVDLKDFPTAVLLKPEEVKAEQQWGIRKAAPIDLEALVGQFPDPHCTYLILPMMFVPFGAKVIVEGQFPHCRFFNLQANCSFHPEAYHFSGWAGVGEVPIVDVDIEPEPGNANPFRKGARRDAEKRSYRVEFDVTIGNPAKIDPAFRPPFYRAKGNRRVASGIHYQGPWGKEKNFMAHGRGVWDIGGLWVRYYAPDKSRGTLAGVPLPKVMYELADGRQFFLQVDPTTWTKRMNYTQAARRTEPQEPPETSGPKVGWGKQWGLFRAILSGVLNHWKLASKDYIRRLDKGVCARGEDMPPPGNYEPSATTCTYINYLNRGMALGRGKICVLTGRLPTTPKTCDGQAVMEGAQARYWSLTGYDISMPKDNGYAGAAIHSIMDEDIVVDRQRRYVMVFSRAEDRPKNAIAENGVTWVNWGPTSVQTWTLRWLSVAPQWIFSKTPHEKNLGWATDPNATCYNPALLGGNSHDGWLGDYLPKVHYLSKTDFEALGIRVTPSRIPVWQ